MTNGLYSALTLATKRRSGTDYPNIGRVELPAGSLAVVPRAVATRALFMIRVIRGFERWLVDHIDLLHGPLHSSIGQEATAVGMGLSLQSHDTMTSTHRAHHDVLAKIIAYHMPRDFDPLVAEGVPEPIKGAVRRTLAEVLGLAQGLAGGRGGSMHIADEEAGILTSAIVGGGIPVAVGQALAAKLRQNRSVAVAIFGDGATSIGGFHESMALARTWELPVIFLLENNGYSVATPVAETAGFEDLAIRASGHDMPALMVDGMDPIAVWSAVSRARAHAVTSGPVFIEARSYRFYHQNGPLAGSAFRYRTKDEEAEWAARDPVATYPARLVDDGVLSLSEVDRVSRLGDTLIDDCAAPLVAGEPGRLSIPTVLYPDPESIEEGVLGPGPPWPAGPANSPAPIGGEREISYAAAISEVIGHWLEHDSEAFVIGEEVGHLGGGVFGLTRAAVAAAPARVLSAPICENGFVGAAFGAALLGMHPIVELMYPDFAFEGADQLFNHIPKARYMYGGHHRVPLVVRTQVSRGRGFGPQHSCDPAALFALLPGWRITAPSTASDYVGLFNAAMLTRDPVLVIDDNRLGKLTALLPAAGLDHVIPPGTARRVRSGTDVTVLCWSYALTRVAAIAERLADQGISVEIIDPRWLDRASFDRQTILDSVDRTGALIIVEDAAPSFSMGSRIIDYLLPELFDSLRTAPVRVTGLDVYLPVSKPLETRGILQDEDIEQAIGRVVTSGRRHEKGT